MPRYCPYRPWSALFTYLHLYEPGKPPSKRFCSRTLGVSPNTFNFDVMAAERERLAIFHRTIRPRVIEWLQPTPLGVQVIDDAMSGKTTLVLLDSISKQPHKYILDLLPDLKTEVLGMEDYVEVLREYRSSEGHRY